MVNICEPLYKHRELKKSKKKNMLTYSSQKTMQSGIQTGPFCIADVVLPVDKKESKVFCLSDATWKPRIIPEQGRQIVKFADGHAGTGGRKKRMLCCNGIDTSECLARNRAHVRLVFHCKRICRTDIMEGSK